MPFQRAQPLWYDSGNPVGERQRMEDGTDKIRSLPNLLSPHKNNGNLSLFR